MSTRKRYPLIELHGKHVAHGYFVIDVPAGPQHDEQVRMLEAARDRIAEFMAYQPSYTKASIEFECDGLPAPRECEQPHGSVRCVLFNADDAACVDVVPVVTGERVAARSRLMLSPMPDGELRATIVTPAGVAEVSAKEIGIWAGLVGRAEYIGVQIRADGTGRAWWQDLDAEECLVSRKYQARAVPIAAPPPKEAA